MKKHFFSGIMVSAVYFLALFLFQLIFTLAFPYAGVMASSGIVDRSYSFGYSARKNFASVKKTYSPVKRQQFQIEQKYEMVADIYARTKDFEKDKAATFTIVEEYTGIIQLQKEDEKKGGRSLSLSIGVKPGDFEKFVKEVKKIGKLQTLDVSKTDMTNEYQEMMASVKSLENKYANIKKLEGQQGKIEEKIKLQETLFAIKSELQQLGVNLGSYDFENEFCTVKFTLSEHDITFAMTFLQASALALRWALGVFLSTCGILLLLFITILLVILILVKVKILEK